MTYTDGTRVAGRAYSGAMHVTAGDQGATDGNVPPSGRRLRDLARGIGQRLRQYLLDEDSPEELRRRELEPREWRPRSSRRGPTDRSR